MKKQDITRVRSSIMTAVERVPSQPVSEAELKEIGHRHRKIGYKPTFDTSDESNSLVVGTTDSAWPFIPSCLMLEGHSLNVGVYIVTGSKGVGKTLSVAALSQYAIGYSLPSAYYSLFEPRCPEIRKSKGSKPLFTKAEAFIPDLKTLLSAPLTASSKQAGLLVLDSITQPMKAESRQYPNQTTFRGGMQPSDMMFITRLQSVAYAFNLVLICVINTALIDYAESLAAVSEGLINVKAPGILNYFDRGSVSKRQAVEITIPEHFVNAAAIRLGYGEFRARRQSSRRFII